MNAGSPTAVVHSSCLSSSTCNSTARQGSALNVGLPRSPVRRLLPAECALSLSSAVANPSFFHIPHRRRKHSPKFVFVVQGSRSTFEFDEARKRQGLQTAEFARERLEHATQGRVSWSPDGKATILWATQKQGDKASLLHEKRQLSGAQEYKKADELSGKFGSRHGSPVRSVGEHRNWQNRQRESPLARTSSQSLPSRQQSELFNPSSASRLLIGSPAFKEVAETDILGSPISSVKGEAKSLTPNEYIQIQGGARIQKSPPCKEDPSQDESVLKSKLEEILNNFRTSQRREEVWRDRTRQKGRDDQRAAPSELLGLKSEVGRKGSNINTRQSYSTQREKVKEQKRASSVGFKTSEHEPSKKKEKPSWQSHCIHGLPFEIQYSYSEAPNAPIIRYREEPYSPFGPRTLSRPWTGGPPKKKSKKNLPLFDSFNPPPKGMKGIKHVQDPGPYREGQGPKPAKSRDAIIGEPLTAQEVAELIEVCYNEKRQLNLGRDGLTHNMLDLIHTHWKRRRVIKVRCLGVPTVDMDNVCFHLEDKTGGKVIFRSGGNVYLFRGRNYNYKDRPEIPLMLWKPITPVYPKLIKRAPEGLTEEEAAQLRLLGKKVEPLCTLRKNGIYLTLVNDVRSAFKLDTLVRIDCRGLNPSDYKKIGAKLKDLVPCVLLSFDDEQILMWRGKETSIDVNSLKGSETAEGFTKESSMSHVESTSTSINDLKAGVSANVSRAERNDSCSGTEEIQHASSSLKGFNNHPIAQGSANGEVENATIDGLPTSSWSLDNEHADVTGATPHMVDLNEPDFVFQDTILQKKNNIKGHIKEREVLPDATCIEERQYTESSLLTEDQDRESATLQAALALESRSTSLDMGVDGLWDQAIASGIAIELGDVEIDNDIVMKKAIELAKAFPAVEVYSRKLMRELEPKTRKVFKPENDVHKHLKKIRKMKLEKKLSKRPFRVRTADVPEDLPQDGTRNSGMPVDELARLLSLR